MNAFSYIPLFLLVYILTLYWRLLVFRLFACSNVNVYVCVCFLCNYWR